jgi:hypothetical protein
MRPDFCRWAPSRRVRSCGRMTVRRSCCRIVRHPEILLAKRLAVLTRWSVAVVIASLDDLHLFAVGTVDKAVFVVDAARPVAGQVALQRLRLPVPVNGSRWISPVRRVTLLAIFRSAPGPSWASTSRAPDRDHRTRCGAPVRLCGQPPRRHLRRLARPYRAGRARPAGPGLHRSGDHPCSRSSSARYSSRSPRCPRSSSARCTPATPITRSWHHRPGSA